LNNTIIFTIIKTEARQIEPFKIGVNSMSLLLIVIVVTGSLIGHSIANYFGV
jgi:hypothetical protein